jgi:hypothetical protein
MEDLQPHMKEDKNIAVIVLSGLQSSQISVFCMAFSVPYFARLCEVEKQVPEEFAQIHLFM